MAKKETPLMTQYNRIKAKYPDAVLLFRVGDFYETFGEDAIRASQILNIILTKRANGSASHIELAGFPYHSLENYLPKLVRAGLRVAICEQLEDPKQAKGIVKRGVTELVTPGVTYNENVLDSGQNNFLAAIHADKTMYGVAYLDISTGEFYLFQGTEAQVLHSFDTLQPKEILVQRGKDIPFALKKKQVFKMEDWAFQHAFAYEKLTGHFKTASLKGFGVDDLSLAITAAGAVMVYLTDDTRNTQLKHISKISRLPYEDALVLDAFTIRNLELLHSSGLQNQHDPMAHGLLGVIDLCKSPMGHRMLRRRLIMPLKNVAEINRRLHAVRFFFNDPESHSAIRTLIQKTGDIERLVGKLASEKIQPKELGNLRDGLQAAQDLYSTCLSYPDLAAWCKTPDSSLDILTLLYSQLADELPTLLSKANVIREGVNPMLDEYRNIRINAKNILEDILQKAILQTGITSLKIDFNSVFGYYLEVRNAHKASVPEEWVRKQTLVNAERYITSELKELEEKILSAESKISEIESKQYFELLREIAVYIPQIQDCALAIAELDCATALAELAHIEHYSCPEISEENQLEIRKARHPMIEKALPSGEKYIPNDVFLDPKTSQVIMVTGPNMSGKSAILRQTALISILAQMGSYVPAEYAKIGVLDKIFTRVGASDNISAGESTFMVEMNEAANILNNLSSRSLILLDELGRGTSTYDGVSIAWAIAEYLHEHPARPKVLFATHYHELNEMQKSFERIKNFHVAIQEHAGSIIFLRTLEPGGSEHSFGIHVARLAGIPKSVLKRASEILEGLEKNRNNSEMQSGIKKIVQDQMQLSFFQLDDPVLENIRDEIDKLDINTLTPVEALMKLNAIKKLISSN